MTLKYILEIITDVEDNLFSFVRLYFHNVHILGTEDPIKVLQLDFISQIGRLTLCGFQVLSLRKLMGHQDLHTCSHAK